MKLATKFRIAMLAIRQTLVSSGSASPYHPAYGLPDTIRIRAVRIAEQHGVKVAAAECNVAVPTVYKWIRAYANSAITK